MKRLWNIFHTRQDLEYAFVALLLSGLMLATSVFVMSTDGQGSTWEGLLILCGILLATFIASGLYFIVGIRGYLARQKK